MNNALYKYYVNVFYKDRCFDSIWLKNKQTDSLLESSPFILFCHIARETNDLLCCYQLILLVTKKAYCNSGFYFLDPRKCPYLLL